MAIRQSEKEFAAKVLDGGMKNPTREQKRVAKSYRHSEHFQKPYDGDPEVIDPSGLGATLEGDPFLYDHVYTLHKKEPKEIHRMATLDIEGWAGYPEIMAMGCLYDPEDPDPDPDDISDSRYKHKDGPHKLASSWHNEYEYEYYTRGPKKGQIKRDFRGNPVVKSVKWGLIELIENMLLKLPSGDYVEPYRIDIFAHNGRKYDWRGFALELFSNVDLDTSKTLPDDPNSCRDMETGEVLTPSKKAKYLLDPQIKPYMKNMLKGYNQDSSASALIRRRKVRTEKRRIAEGREIYPVKPKRSGAANDEYVKNVTVEITDGEGDSRYITWLLKPCGNDYYIEASITNEANIDGGSKHKIRLLDSITHLTASIDEMGPKGVLHEMFKNPPEWLSKEVEEGRLDISHCKDESEISEVGERHWRESAWTEENIAYVKQDCETLYEALKEYREAYESVVKNPTTGRPINPLAFLTSAQSALTAQIALSHTGNEDSTPKYGNPYIMTFSPAAQNWDQPKQGIESDPVRIANFINSESGTTECRAPIFPNQGKSYCKGGFYQYGKYAEKVRPASFGGRTELFKIMVAMRKKLVSIDKNSMYPSVGSDDRLKYADPRFFRDLKEPIVGKANALAHLSKFSGVYNIVTRPATNPVIRDKFPIFPIRVSNTDYESRAVYGTWEGKINLRVTGEELRYFLEVTDVENDDITILPEGSVYSNLVEARHMPFYRFFKVFYNMRLENQRKSRKALERAKEYREQGREKLAEDYEERGRKLKAKAMFAKMQLVAGGFGVFLQTDTDDNYMIPGDAERNREKLMMLKAIHPDWKDWEDMTEHGIKPQSRGQRRHASSGDSTWKSWKDLKSGEEKSEFGGFGSDDAITLAENFCIDHHIRRHRDLAERHLLIRIPGRLSGHAIPSIGVAMTAHARVDLHKAMMTVDSIPAFEVLYCDTDSVKFEVPESMPMDKVRHLLETTRVRFGDHRETLISIGDDLGQWKIEPNEINPDLVGKGEEIDLESVSAIFLAPKVYMQMSQLIKKPGQRPYHRLHKEVVKGIHQFSTPMRVALKSLFIPAAKLGDHKDSSMMIHQVSDLTESMKTGEHMRRIFTSMYEQSKPIVFRQPKKKEWRKGAYTWHTYMRDVAREGFKQIDPQPLIDALKYYENSVKVSDTMYVKDLQKKVSDEIGQFMSDEASILMELLDVGKMIRANAMLEKLKQSWLVTRKEKREEAGDFFDNTVV